MKKVLKIVLPILLLSLNTPSLVGSDGEGLPLLHASVIDTIAFRGDSSHIIQRVCVYTPACYADDSVAYPLVYLCHGIHGNHYSWLRDGQMQSILDSLISNHIIRPMVVAMPYCQRFDTSYVDEPRSLIHCLFNYGSILRGEFEDTFFEIDDTICRRYRVSLRKQDRAIAGLSCGARQAAVIAKNDSSFGMVGLFCPVIHTRQLPKKMKAKFDAEKAANDSLMFQLDAEMNEWYAPTEYWVGVTEGDVFLYKGRRFVLNAKKRKIPITLYQDKGSHNWKAWRQMLDLFMKHFFSTGEAENPE